MSSGDPDLDQMAAREQQLIDAPEEGSREALPNQVSQVENERDDLRRQLRHLMETSRKVVVYYIEKDLCSDGLVDLREEWEALMKQEYPS